MNRRLLSMMVLIMSLSMLTQAQVYIYGGYGTSYPRLDNLNYVLERYNDTRNYLTSEMEPFRSLNGFSMTFGTAFVGFDFGIGYLNRSEKRFAEGTVQGADYRRDLKATMNAFEMHTGGSFNVGKGGFAIGVRLEIGQIKVKTKITENGSTSDPDWSIAMEDIHSSAGPYVRIHLGKSGLALEPYFMWPLFETNVADLNRAINPNTYQNDPDPLNIKPKCFGFSILLGSLFS